MKKFLKEYTLELIAGAIILCGVFLMVVDFPVRNTVVTASSNVLTAILGVLGRILSGVNSRLEGLAISDALGILMVLTALGYLVWRIRYRFHTSPRWESDNCPKCNGSIMRVHRTWWDHFLGATLLPEARRYSCVDPLCGWSGLLRRRIHHTHHRNARVSESENP